MSHRLRSDIAVIGGGIGGVCLALGLLKQGLRPTLYESAKSFGELGAGIAVGPNARQALRLLGDDVWASVQPVLTCNKSEDQKLVHFNIRAGAVPSNETQRQETDIITQWKSQSGLAAAHRAHFLDQLVKLMPDGITQFNKRALHIEDLGYAKGVRIVFRDGSEAIHGAVIGCDGIHSIVRKHILGWDNAASTPRFSGKFVHRGLIPMDKATEALGEETATNSNIYVGPHGYINTLPVDHGAFMNIGVFHSADSWPHEEWVISPQQHGEDLQGAYAGWCSPVQKILVLMEKTDLWAIFDYCDKPASSYYRGHACIMGDAAHASTPSQGSGAAMAMEDAAILSELVAHALARNVDVSVAFRAFDMVRRPRTQLLAETSREAGRIWSLEHAAIGNDLNKLAATIENRFDWIFEWKYEEELCMGKRFIEVMA